MLSGPAIEWHRDAGNIDIEPFNPAHVGANSYDLTLSNQILVYDREDMSLAYQSIYRHGDPGLDMQQECKTHTLHLGPDGMWLFPGQLYLAASVERITLKGLAAKVDGRSSVGRLGLRVHQTAGFFDDGFSGVVTFELDVILPLKIYPGVRIAQMSVEQITGPRKPYSGKYQAANGPQASRLWRDFLPKEEAR